MNFTPDALLALVGVVLSLAFAYFPWLKQWFEGMDVRFKPLFMAGVLLLVTAGKLLIDCQFAAACLQANWANALWGWFLALVANQTTFATLVKQPKRVEAENAADASFYAAIDEE